jgi:PBP1b-binding outer membrane lipoprotein LpoB
MIMKKLMKLLTSLLLAVTLVGCSSNNEDDANLEEYADCLQRVMDEAAAAGTDKFDMSVCDNL